MPNLVFAIFNLGAMEMLILGVVFLAALGVAVAIFIGLGSKNRDDADD